MYDQTFSRQNPGCIVVLLDRSESMGAQWRNSGMTLADGAARAINRLLLDLCIKSTKEVGGAVRDYFHVLVLGYGASPVAGGEGVESAFGGRLTGRGIIPLSDLASAPLAILEEPSVDAMAAVTRVPIWVEPVFGYRTPMCEAIAVAGAHVFEWVEAHPDSFPPIVINITDGLVTDSPYDGADLTEWAKRLTTVETVDGPTLLFNVFLSSEGDPAFFPTSGHAFPEPGPQLFDMSSVLPAPMVRHAQAAGVPVQPGARAMCFNADLEALVKFLEIGTRVAEIPGR
ncbi:hypothetical protein SAMN05660209_02101 [Geodermatophilus africanus]|uniref:VWFA domain-containing protein n=1 Tax=Geodermatophilus africanus TaxID=1137993 RepID=A0A1H3HHF5_9ACTN|nr:hypothetical protein [Geodermatophilus africanus]SDY14655.1 hypothetical protein SAMN05660209_02101 [Geodermatophilus africanus]